MASQPVVLAILFSRDRAMQLDATLRSFFLHCRDAYLARLFVIYYASDDLHAQQYLGLKQAYQHVHFVQQQSFREDVLGRLMFGAIPLPEKARRLGIRLARKNDRFARLTFALLRRPAYLLFLVDDNLFVRDFSLAEITKELVADLQALGFSLRLGTNTTYCYSLSKPQKIPVFAAVSRTIRKYDWTVADGDFGYPLEVSSSVFRLKDLLRILFHLPFKNPNVLETQLSSQASYFGEATPELLCYEQSVTFCNPINKVQTIYSDNRSGSDIEYNSANLAALYEDGYGLQVEAFTGFVPNACHQEVELVFKRLER